MFEKGIEYFDEVAHCKMGHLTWFNIDVVLVKVHGVFNHQKSIYSWFKNWLINTHLHFYLGLVDSVNYFAMHVIQMG